MKALLVQPPFVQLNAPYPAVHYLESFLRSRGVEARSVDHSIELYRSLFSRRGLVPVFEAARRMLEASTGPRRLGVIDEASASAHEPNVCYEGLYLEWIDSIAAFLAGEDPAFAHRLAQAVELPLGMRSSAFLESREGRISEAEAGLLATTIIDDLGDLVAFALDPSFATVRYGERIAASASSFAPIRRALDESPLLASAYRDLLAAEWAKEASAPDFLLVSIPFPGCLLGAMACARSAREAFGSSLRIVFGGGYVSTELRSLRDGGIFDFCDYLCFDSGYGSLASIIEAGGKEPAGRLYKVMYRDEDGRLVAAGFDPEDEAAEDRLARRQEPCSDAGRFRSVDDEALRTVSPDYASADFRRYLRVAESENSMHKLWSDSPWLKYRLAQGCYWRRCAFCDTGLEYVSRYLPVDIPSLVAAAAEASRRSGLFGIHFVDEAMPMRSLLGFAQANRARAISGERPFHFWGNVRFDSSWTPDRCEYLAASGLVAVSGGIEIATEAGLEMTDKGFDLEGLVRTLVAMRRAGLLVHAYLIYGFPGQGRDDILDSAEVCRQLFASGLIDSAFWHRFVLTRHSRMYGEYLAGSRPGLRPLDRPWDFANNDLGFAGEESYDEFDGPLASTLELWMTGRGLEEPAAASLAAAGLGGEGRASIGPLLVEGLVTEAEERFDRDDPTTDGRAQWIAGLPSASPKGDSVSWAYRGELRRLAVPRGRGASIAASLRRLAGSPGGRPFAELAEELGLDGSAARELRSAGLVVA